MIVLTPQYISLEDVMPLLQSKIAINDIQINAIPVEVANSQIALAEAEVETILASFWAVPLVCSDGSAWTNLPNTSLATLYKLFTGKAIERLVKLYFNGIYPKDASEFYKSYFNEFKDFNALVQKKDESGFYQYLNLFPGMMLSNYGKSRVMKVPQTGNIGGYANPNMGYAMSNMNNVTKNWITRIRGS